jgi:hypothetical protein
MEMNGTMGKNKFKHRRVRMSSWLLVGGLAPGTAGRNTCIQANGCTQAWPETLLSNGASAAKAGSGVQSALLGTVKDASGHLEVTYNHWRLYTFSADPGPGAAQGQGLTSYGGTWYVLNGSGHPVTSRPTGNSSSGGGNGY